MDELEFEARLRSRLHRRFDGAEPPASLRAVPVALPTTVRRGSIRALPRTASVAWLAAATLILALVAGLGFRAWSGPGGPGGPTPTPVESPAPQYLVLPNPLSVPTKAETASAVEVMSQRLRAIGIGTFTSSAGYGVTFELPGELPPAIDEALIRRVLAATGTISVVPLPPEDYGDGKATAVVGRRLPIDEPVLFGADQVASSGVATENGVPIRIHFDLRPAGTAALDAFTTAHVGETFAVLVDDVVVLVPTVMGEIPDGRLELQGGEASSIAFLAAVVTSGTLPEAWRGARVPEVIGAGEASEIALSSSGATGVVATQLTTLGLPREGDGLMPAWLVTVSGTFSEVGCASPGTGATAAPCGTFDTALVSINAEDRTVVVTQVPAP